MGAHIDRPVSMGFTSRNMDQGVLKGKGRLSLQRARCKYWNFPSALHLKREFYSYTPLENLLPAHDLRETLSCGGNGKFRGPVKALYADKEGTYCSDRMHGNLHRSRAIFTANEDLGWVMTVYIQRYVPPQLGF